MSKFASAGYTARQLNAINAIVKKLRVMAGKDGPEKLLRDELLIQLSRLLQPFATVSVPAAKEFSSKNTFGAIKPAIKLWYLGDNFKQYFLGKVEKNVSSATLIAHTLTRASLDAPILAELGDKAETSLVHLWELLTKQANGEAGVLLTNSYCNIFFIRDDNGELWAVRASWSAELGWIVDASSVDYPLRWYAVCRVFSRK